MTDCKCNQKPYTILPVSEMDVDELETMPDYFFATRKVKDPSTGDGPFTPALVPGDKVLPTGSKANVAMLVTNNPALSVPEAQVRAGYVDVQPGGNIVKLTANGSPAMFLMVGMYSDGRVLIQSTGFLNLPEHHYLVGEEYYDDGEGVPTTDSTLTGRKLFMPLSDSLILVNGDF